MPSFTAKKRIGLVLALGFAALNLTAYRHARAFTHFAPPGHRTRPQLLSFGEKVQTLLVGVEVPRPENRQTPRDVGLAYERHVFAGGRGVPLEAWLVPRVEARGTVVLFHGHAGSKDSQLREAKASQGMGLNAFLVDFYGSGGSGGNETSIGFYEALDVTKAFAYARELPRPGPVVLYGASMVAAAILKAVADDKLEPAALILECPFDSLIRTVRHRFTSWGIPSLIPDVHDSCYHVHTCGGGVMASPALRHKHVRIDQAKLEKAKRVLDARTDTETLDRALSLVVTEGEIDGALRGIRGKGKLKKVFR